MSLKITSPTSPSFPALQTAEITKKKKLVEVPRTAILATPLNFLRLPYDFVVTAVAWVKAENKKDTEGRIDAALRLAAGPISFLQKVQTSLGLLTKISAVLGINIDFFKLPGSLIHWLLPASILGSFLCVIEGIYESISVARVVSLKKHIPLVFQPKEYLREWQHLNDEYFTLNKQEISDIQKMVEKKFSALEKDKKISKCEELQESLLTVKQDNLARRIRPWLVEEISEKIKPLLAQLQSPDPLKRTQARREIEQIFKNMDIQCKKKLLVHVIGLVALLCTGLGFLLPFLACPFLIPLLLLGAGGFLSFIRYFVENGYQDQRGWNFSLRDCIPPFVLKLCKA